MGKAKGRARQERHLVVISTPLPEPTTRWSPDPEKVEDFPVEIPLLGLGRIKGRQGLDTDTGRMVEFALVAQIEVAGLWREIARVDTDHEEVHLHILTRQGLAKYREVLFPINGPQDVDRGWDEGMRRLLADWDERVRRWRGGH